jgi:predicted RNA-binding protein with PIN domain
MAMPILIDGHNLIGRLPSLSLEDPDDEMQLVEMLMSYQARTGKAITVVFDPGGAHSLAQTRTRGRVRSVFAPHGSSADRMIEHRVQKSRNASEWLVVTSDRGLADSVAREGARIRSSEAFAAELGAPGDVSPGLREVPPSPDEVEAWLAEFERRD